MKLLFLMPLASPWARNFVSQIDQLGHDVYVIDPSSRKSSKMYFNVNDLYQKENIAVFIESLVGVTKIHSSLGYYWSMFKAIFVIKKITKSFKPDARVVLYGGIWGLIACLSAVKPLILYVVGSDILYGGIIKKNITKLVLNASDQIFSNGMYLRDQAQKLAPKANIKNLYFGIDTRHFSLVKHEKETPIIIVCTRGFKTIYNNKYLIDGLNVLSNEQKTEIKVIFTSKGPLLEEIKEYSTKTLNATLRNKIEFLGGVSDKILKKVLQSGHIYISLSLSDGSSISLMEAMSCGLFPVLSDIPANRTWITEQNGLLVPLNNPMALANCINLAISNKALRERARIINRRLIVNKADSKKNTQNFIKIVDDVILQKEIS